MSHEVQHSEDQEHDEHDHEHEHGPLAELVTVRDWLRYAVTRFNRAGIFCGAVGSPGSLGRAGELTVGGLHEQGAG